MIMIMKSDDPISRTKAGLGIMMIWVIVMILRISYIVCLYVLCSSLKARWHSGGDFDDYLPYSPDRTPGVDAVYDLLLNELEQRSWVEGGKDPELSLDFMSNLIGFTLTLN